VCAHARAWITQAFCSVGSVSLSVLNKLAILCSMNPFEKAEEKYWLDGVTSSDEDSAHQSDDEEEWEQKWDEKFAALKKDSKPQQQGIVSDASIPISFDRRCDDTSYT
jgi:hypothetical protein